MKEINKYTPKEGYLKSKDKKRGNSDVDGDNFCTELIHGAKDFGGTNFGFIVTEDSIYWGNNTSYLEWKMFIDRWIEDPMSGSGKKTSHWGTGTSKEASFKDGIPEWQLAGDPVNDIYKIRIWEGVSDIPDEKFKSYNAVKTLLENGLVIKEYELTKEEYMSYVPKDFDFEPTHLNKIRRFSNSLETYDSKKLIDNIDLTTIFSSGQLHDKDNTVWVKVLNSPKKYSKQSYLPVIGNDNTLVNKLNQLPILDTLKVNGATIEVRVGKRPKPDDIDTSNYNTFEYLKKQLKWPVFPIVSHIDSRGTRPIVMWTNNDDVVLPVYECWKMMKKYLPPSMLKKEDSVRDKCQDNICILKVVEPGDLEFNTIKTSKPFTDMLEISCNAFAKVVEKNPDLHYCSDKEASRVKLYIDHLVNSGSYRPGLIVSLRKLTDNNLTEDDLDDIVNHEDEEDYAKRNLDWLISPTDILDHMIHLEFSLKKQDYKHEDQVFRKVGYDIAPYHAWVCKEIDTSKLKKLMDDLKKRPPHPSVEKIWLVENDDFRKGNTKEFILLWERK